MNIEWFDCEKPQWGAEENKKKFIEKFESEIWPDYYELLGKQPINALGVNTYVKLVNGIDTRINFEIEPGIEEGCIHIYVFPWHCVHKPESINERFKTDENDAPWLTGRCFKKYSN